MKTVGIIGGMGPLATSDLYRNIIMNTKANVDQEHLHVIIDGNTNIPDRTKSILEKKENPLIEMRKSAQLLQEAGADFLIMPCNTAHYYYMDLIKAVDIPIINMLEETVNYIKQKDANKTVGLLATDGTIQSGIYDKYFQREGLVLVKPKKNQNKVMEFIYEGIKKGNYDIGMEGLNQAIEELEETNAKVFVLGCTELSSATYIYQFSDEFIDPLIILAKAAIKYAGGSINEETKKN